MWYTIIQRDYYLFRHFFIVGYLGFPPFLFSQFLLFYLIFNTYKIHNIHISVKNNAKPDTSVSTTLVKNKTILTSFQLKSSQFQLLLPFFLFFSFYSFITRESILKKYISLLCVFSKFIWLWSYFYILLLLVFKQYVWEMHHFHICSYSLF